MGKQLFVSMYIRTLTRKNKNGSIVKYYQLAHNERNPRTKKPVPRIIHNFGRADGIDRNAMIRLCRSIARICDLEIVDKQEASTARKPLNISGKIPESIETVSDAGYRQELTVLKDKINSLRESEKKFKTFFENANDEIVYVDTEGKIVEVNEATRDIFGWTREETIGKHFNELGLFNPENANLLTENFKHSFKNIPIQITEIEVLRKDGTPAFIEVNAKIIEIDGEVKGILNIVRDITKRKQAENSLTKHRDNLEELVTVRTQNLKDTNTALKILLKKREEDKSETEENMLLNVKELVLPFLEEMKTGRLDDRQKALADILEYNLNNIISPFVRELSSRYLALTPTEIRIANFIKQGKTTKEIAGILKMSSRTIDNHRYSIRKKFGINNKRANLATYLMSLK